MTGVTETPALLAWVANYGNYVVFFAQLAYWVVLGFAALWAVTLFKRLVDHQTGAGTTWAATASRAGKTAEGADSDDEPIAIEEFVE